MIPHSAARAYAQIGLETGVAAASPHRLVMMLYDGAIVAIADAASHMAARRVADKGQSISKAIAIIDEGLKASVDVAKGGEIAQNLRELYDFMNRRLLLSSLRNDSAGLAEVTQLLGELRAAWAGIADRAPPVADPDRSEKPTVLATDRPIGA